MARRIAHVSTVAGVILAPLLIAGAHGGVQVALAVGMLQAVVAWVISRRAQLRFPPFAALGAAALAATVLQLLPLPAFLVGWLSPRALELRTEVSGSLALLPLTLDVPATVMAAVRLVPALIILVITADAVRWRGRTQIFALPLALIGGALGVLSFAQRWLGATTILGVYQVQHLPGSGFFGTFVNGNHAASLFALSALVAIGAARESTGSLRLVLGGSAFISMAALFSTGSRMGTIGLIAGILGLATCWLVNRFGGKRGLLIGGAVAAVALPVTMLIAISLRRPLSDVTLATLFDDQKLRGWRDSLALVRAYPWTGVGRGAFEGPATVFRQDAEGVRLVYPENLLLQMATEWGLPVSLTLIALFVTPAWKIVRRVPRWEPVLQGAACGVLAVLVHELADFGLELPGVAFPTALALGLCAGRLSVSSTEATANEQTRYPRRVAYAALACFAGVCLASFWAVNRTTAADEKLARQLRRAPSREAMPVLEAMVRRHPADYYFELMAASHAVRTGADRALHHINRAMRLQPHSPTGHLLAFRQLARVGQKPQAAMEYRLAVEKGHPFSYREVVDAVGPALVFRAVPRQPGRMFELATALVLAGRPAEADEATARAVEMAEGSEPARTRRLEIALASNDTDFMRKAARELFPVAITSRAHELVADGLARTGELAPARTILRRGAASNPGDPALALRGARILFSRGDLDGARALLVERSSDLPLTDRIAAEELIAQIAERQGSRDLAAAARARARMLSRLQESPPPP